MNFFGMIRIAWNVFKEIRVQKKYNHSFLIPYLDELEKKYNGQFPSEQRQKILNYYGIFITAFLCSSYKKLAGTTLSFEERKRATLFGILTPVGDDLFDLDKLDEAAIRQITFHPETYNAQTFSSNVAKEIQTYLLTHVPHREAYILASKNVLDIQAETIKQTDTNTSRDETTRITYTKGAVSVIIYHQCLDEAANAQIQEALFYVGSLYQLGNDIFDLYKDVRDNIYTLINTCDDFTAFRKVFLERVSLQNKKIMELPFPEKNKKDFCVVMNTINARSMVALDQFVKYQQKKGEKINWWKEDRKTMITDMEKPMNFLKWLRYCYTLPKMISTH